MAGLGAGINSSQSPDQKPGHGTGHFYLKNIKIHSHGRGPGIGTSPVPERYRSCTGSGTEE